jgi:hypothetical protein
MANPQLLKYIQGSLANNIPLEQIKKKLSAAGWPDLQINEAVNSLNQAPLEGITEKKPVPVGIKIISILFYITGLFGFSFGIMIALGTSVISVIISEIPEFAILAFFGSTLFIITGIILMGFAILAFFIGRGLWKGQNWARIITIIFEIMTIMGIVAGIIMGIYIYEVVISIVPLIITTYLLFSRKVKEAFS